MTTNVLDKRNNRVTSDSRWSVEDRDRGIVYFVDDTGFDKISERPTAVMVCAGSAKLIDLWKLWFAAPDLLGLPASEEFDQHGNLVAEIAVTIISKPGFDIEFSRGWYQQHEDAAYFCGTGGVAAKDCYSINGCSNRCVESAKASDPCTGGEVKFYELDTFNHNLSNPQSTLLEMQTQLIDRGYAMNRATKETMPINPLTQEEFRQQLANGKLTISAPSGVPNRKWTERERHDAQEAMRKIVDREKAANT